VDATTIAAIAVFYLVVVAVGVPAVRTLRIHPAGVLRAE
jgi:hypothetical protein